VQVHPEVARLRSGIPAQPRTDAALAAWQAQSEVAALRAALADYAAGAALAEVPGLAALMHAPEAGRALVEGLVEGLTGALAAEPLAQLPLGHATTPGLARLRLAGAGRAALALVAHAPRARAMPASALFEDGAAHELVLAGAGTALLHRRHDGRLTTREVALAPGTAMAREGLGEARQIIAVARPLLVLQLTRIAAEPQPSEEVALADRRCVKVISGCKRTSQQIMALGVLGALRHRPAVPAMAETARRCGAARDIRWEALRQCLALDTRAGLALLAGLAADAGDPLAAPARALQRQLAASDPALAALIHEAA
jgi:hypothetical protein